MILAKVTRDFYGASEAKHRLGEVLKVDVNDHLRKTGFLCEVEPGAPLVHCSCGRMFLVVEGDDPEQLLNAHIAELGKGHKRAGVKEKVAA